MDIKEAISALCAKKISTDKATFSFKGPVPGGVGEVLIEFKDGSDNYTTNYVIAVNEQNKTMVFFNYSEGLRKKYLFQYAGDSALGDVIIIEFSQFLSFFLS